jgi:hypothetical protein
MSKPATPLPLSRGHGMPGLAAFSTADTPAAGQLKGLTAASKSEEPTLPESPPPSGNDFWKAGVNNKLAEVSVSLNLMTS